MFYDVPTLLGSAAYFAVKAAVGVLFMATLLVVWGPTPSDEE